MQAFLTSRTTRRIRAAVASCILLAFAGVAIGCASDDAAVERPTTTAPAGSTVETTARPAAAQIVAYFPTANGEGIEKVVAPATGSAESRLAEALDILVAGPGVPELGPALPVGTRVLSASTVGATARINLSTEFAAGYPTGGSAAEIAALAPIVFTATEVDGVDSVLITVDGVVPDVAGQFDLSAPLGRGDFPPEIVGGTP